MPSVLFQTALRRQLGVSKVEMLEAETITLGELLDNCEKQLGQPIKKLLVDSNGQLAYGMVFLNGRNVLLLDGLSTLINPNDEVNIFPPAGGG